MEHQKKCRRDEMYKKYGVHQTLFGEKETSCE